MKISILENFYLMASLAHIEQNKSCFRLFACSFFSQEITKTFKTLKESQDEFYRLFQHLFDPEYPPSWSSFFKPTCGNFYPMFEISPLINTSIVTPAMWVYIIDTLKEGHPKRYRLILKNNYFLFCGLFFPTLEMVRMYFTETYNPQGLKEIWGRFYNPISETFLKSGAPILDNLLIPDRPFKTVSVH